VKGPLTYAAWLNGLKEGRSYVSDGRAHLMDFQATEQDGKVHVSVNAAALLNPVPDADIQSRPLDQKPYWSVERARVGSSREVEVELIVNGNVAAKKPILADGTIREVSFDTKIERSSWIALRIFAAAHTNPIFLHIGSKPIRTSQASAEWALNAVRQCWSQKSARISPAELPAAKAAYDHATKVYERLLTECTAH